ncbi:MAG: hypothetical protein HY787_09735 [Deltaproteobacteria bacterium]|nr:hypothetical protein [Deltaproteobacteria bacterium]
MALSIKAGSIPPTVGLQNPVHTLRFVMNNPIDLPINFGLINGFSSGGTFVSLVLKNIT